jgi:hypothetical protein
MIMIYCFLEQQLKPAETIELPIKKFPGGFVLRRVDGQKNLVCSLDRAEAEAVVTREKKI